MSQLREAFRDIKIAHSLFALPMALTGMLLATGGSLPPTRVLALIVLCMVSGRTAAMGLNRIVDASLDARNPRTAARAIPKGALSPRSMGALVAVSAALFVLGAGLLNVLALALAPVALAVFALYPFTKRVTALCHVVLGIALGAAPLGAWIAVRGDVAATPLLLSLAVLLWVAGFDILYALQDESFDRSANLHSAPVALGGRGARWLARGLHLAMLLALGALASEANLGAWFLGGVAVAAAMLLGSHWLVREGLDRIHTAFFTLNSWLSAAILAGTLLDRWR